MQFIKRFSFIIILLGIYAASLAIQYSLFLNWDVASLLYATKRLLAGGHYVSDIFTPNPPMILYLYTLPVIISQLFHLNIVLIFRIYIYLLCTASLSMCYKLLKKYALLFMPILATGYLILPTYEFGNRDHLLLVLVMPYILAVVSRLEGMTLPRYFAVGTGVLAGIGFAIKPQFLVTFALIELYYLYKKRDLFAWWRAETLIIIGMVAAYTASMFLFYANFIYIIVPFLFRNYYPAIGLPLSIITTYPFSLFCFMSAAFYLLWQYKRPQEVMFTVLIIALMGFVLSIYLQHTLFYYHFLPALTIALLLSVSTLYRFLISKEISRTMMIKMALLIALFISVDVYCSRSQWVYQVFYPWYFYAFFAVTFILLFAMKSQLSLFSILLRVCFIMVTGVMFATLLLDLGFLSHRFLLTLLCFSGLYVVLAAYPGRHFMQQALVVSLVLSLFYVPVMQEYYVYLGPKQYKEGPLNTLTTFINKRGQHQSIYVFSAAIFYTFPTIFYANATTAQRFDQLWPVLGFSKRLNEKTLPLPYHKDKQFFVNMVAEDLHNNKPDLVFIDNGHILGGNFDYITFFSENAYFRKEWKSYRYLTTLSLGKMNMVDTNMPVYERIPDKEVS